MRWLLALGAALVPVAGLGQGLTERLNDYPTVARADYVFACMVTRGQTRQALEQCACSIDEIAAILPYEKYLEAETVLSMRRTGGGRLEVFTSAVAAEAMVAELRRAQAEAELICF